MNRVATSLFMMITFVMVITNFDYLITSTPLYRVIPRVFGISFGIRFLMGPMLYFYTLTVTDSNFKWKKIYFIHFIPYIFNLILNIPLFVMDDKIKLDYINIFLSGSLRFRTVDIVMIAIQNIHMFIYIVLSLRWIRQARLSYRDIPYVIEMKVRIAWLRLLVIYFSVLLCAIFSMCLIIFIHQKYIPAANKVYTIITSAFIYLIAYKLMFNPQLISPDFVKKYKAVKQLKNDNENQYMIRLQSLMNEEKIFTNRDLKLSVLARQLNLTPHQLSRLINEKFAKSFNSLINEYRVQEFIKRIGNPKYEAFSVYGIAMDVGFKSKSSFNSTFKKVTGKIPSEFKSQQLN